MAKVMIVDDSAFTRKMMRKILEELGHQVTEAENGPVAIQQFTSHKPDVITLDMLMPEMEGSEVFDHLKSIDSEVCVIVCTSNVQPTTKAEMINKGAVSFLNKPVKDHMLEEALATALRRKTNATNT